MLLKINAAPAKRTEIHQLAQLFNAEVIDISSKTLTLSVDADPDMIDNLIELVRPYGIKELIRSGRVSLLKG